MRRPSEKFKRASAPVAKQAALPWPARWNRSIGAVVIALAAVCVFWPSLRGGFLLDDDILLTNSSVILDPGGLGRIWFTTDPLDYWPVTNTSFWIEWRLWGMNSTGYRVTNLVLHIASALLVWRVLETLAIPGAWLAALLFAIHPVNVESVAWISQRKNTLSMLLLLLSALWYLNSEGTRHEPTGGEAQSPARLAGPTSLYWLSLGAFILAMLSKGSVAVLPLMLLLVAWWQYGRITRQDLIRTAPLFAVSIVLVLVNAWFQTHGSGEAIRSVTLVERILGAAGVFWFYLYKAALPIDLAFVYPRWTIDASEFWWWVALVAAVLVTGLLIWKRDTRLGRALLFAWLFFGIALVPVMGFADVGFMKYSLVANRYLHIAVIAIVALAGAGWRMLARSPSVTAHRAGLVIALAVATALLVLSCKESALYADPVTLYEDTLIQNPDNWQIRENLGVAVFKRGQKEEGIGHVRWALRVKPDSASTHYNLGNMLRDTQLDEAIEQYREALRLRPDYPEAHNNLAIALVLARRLRDAIVEFQQAVALNPDFMEAHKNLAHALAESGRFAEAVEHFQQVARLRPHDPDSHADLARALADVGQLPKAVQAAEQALKLANARGQKDLAGQIEQRLKAYRGALQKPETGAASPSGSAP